MNAILDERIRQGKTQKRLAHEAGIAARTLRKLERGEEVSLETLGAVRRALGMRLQPHNPAPIDARGTPTPDEKPGAKSRWARTWEQMGFMGWANLALFVMSVLALIGFFYILVDMTIYDLKHNASLVVTVEGECSAAKSDAVANDVANALIGTRVLNKKSHAGTDGCEVRLNLHTDETQAVAVEKLRTRGFHATFSAFRE